MAYIIHKSNIYYFTGTNYATESCKTSRQGYPYESLAETVNEVKNSSIVNGAVINAGQFKYIFAYQ